MLARARGVPMVVGVGRPPDGALSRPAEAIVDGMRGPHPRRPGRRGPRRLRLARAKAAAARGAPIAALPTEARRDRRRHADRRSCQHRRSGASSTRLDPACLRRHRPRAHGTPVRRRARCRTRSTQLAVYRRIAEWAAGRPVTIRTLDAGGDKPIPGLTEDGETNPFLGLRGVRLSLAHPRSSSARSCARWPAPPPTAASRSWCRW